MSFTLKSSVFEDNTEIPRKYTGDGEDVSPPLAWEGAPANTKELVLICDDPDAPSPEPWVHWIAYRLDPRAKELPEGLPHKPSFDLPVHAVQGENSWGKTGYGGPLPPKGHGWHRYFFNLYALSAPVDLPPKATKNEIVEAMGDNVLDKATLVGRYKRG